MSVMNGWMPCGVYVGFDGWLGLCVMGLKVALGVLLGMMVVWGWASCGVVVGSGWVLMGSAG